MVSASIGAFYKENGEGTFSNYCLFIEVKIWEPYC